MSTIFNSLSRLAMMSIAAYIVLSIGYALVYSLSVIWINIIMGIATVVVLFPIMMTGVMITASPSMNDAGSRILTTLAFSYPVTYLLGLIGSISVLYSDIENKEYLATWLASASAVHLALLIIVFFLLLGLEIRNDKM